MVRRDVNALNERLQRGSVVALASRFVFFFVGFLHTYLTTTSERRRTLIKRNVREMVQFMLGISLNFHTIHNQKPGEISSTVIALYLTVQNRYRTNRNSIHQTPLNLPWLSMARENEEEEGRGEDEEKSR